MVKLNPFRSRKNKANIMEAKIPLKDSLQDSKKSAAHVKWNSCGSYSSTLPLTLAEGESRGTALFLIDAQNDFMDGGDFGRFKGSLPVPGSTADSIRTASFIVAMADEIDDIYICQDTHKIYHIAHPSYWNEFTRASKKGSWTSVGHPSPFTYITNASLQPNGILNPDDKLYHRFEPVRSDRMEWAKTYTQALESNDSKVGGFKFQLTIWPEHCLLGSVGHCIQPDVLAALHFWESRRGKSINMVLKGNNSETECYSAFKAEVPVETETSDGEKVKEGEFNMKLYKNLMKHSKIFVAGQARTHCVNHSVRDLTKQMTVDGYAWSRVTLLDGAASDVCAPQPDGSFKPLPEGAEYVKFMTTNDAAKEKFQKDMRSSMVLEDMKCKSLDISAIPAPGLKELEILKSKGRSGSEMNAVKTWSEILESREEISTDLRKSMNEWKAKTMGR